MEFDFTNVLLSAENLVDFQLRKNLSVNIVPEDEILKLFTEITQDLNFPLGFKDFKQILNSQFQSHYHGSDKKPEVMHDEMHKTCSDNGEAWMQTPRPVTKRKVRSTSPMSYHVESRRSISSKDTSSMKVDNQESSSNRTSSSEGMNRTPRMSIAYIDDIDEEEKSVNQEKKGWSIGTKNLSPMSYMANKRKVDGTERRGSC